MTHQQQDASEIYSFPTKNGGSSDPRISPFLSKDRPSHFDYRFRKFNDN